MISLKHFLNTSCLYCLLLFPSLLFAQNQSVDWLNKHAYELKSDSTSGNNALSFLTKILNGKTVIGLGEASHGTHEFYIQKARIIKYLIEKSQYRLIAFESPANYILPINQYIQTGEGDLRTMLKKMGLYNTEEIYQLFTWLRSFNANAPAADRVSVAGFDEEEYWADPLNRDEYMAGNFIQNNQKNPRKSILWSHNVHLAKDTTMAQYKGMGYHIKNHFGDQYYAVGFDTFAGSVSVLNNGQFEVHEFVGAADTFSELFSKVKFESFFIDFRQSPNPLLNTKNTITNIYSNWQEPKPLPIIAGADFDGMVFIRTTTASKTY